PPARATLARPSETSTSFGRAPPPAAHPDRGSFISLPRRATVHPAFEEIDLLGRPRRVARHRAPANSRENRVGVCFDVVERTRGRRSQASLPVPLSKERFDVALEGRPAVVRTRHGVLLFNFRRMGYLVSGC